MAKRIIWVVLFLAAAGQAFAASTPSAGTAGGPSNQFKTEQAAKSHCPGDTVVWATLSRAKAYHLSGDRYYGKTRRGAYMCKEDAIKAGMHQSGSRTTRKTASKSSTSSSGTTSH
jgi:hypothetical protein